MPADLTSGDQGLAHAGGHPEAVVDLGVELRAVISGSLVRRAPPVRPVRMGGCTVARPHLALGIDQEQQSAIL